MLLSGRDTELTEYLSEHPYADLDVLLTDDEILQVESVSYGSWVATVRTRSTLALKAAWLVAIAAFERTREAFIETQEAQARLLNAEADVKEVEAGRGELALKRENFELQKQELECLLEKASNLKDAKLLKTVNRRLRQSIYDLAAGDRREREIKRSARRRFPINGPGAWDYRIEPDGTVITILSRRATRRSGKAPFPRIGQRLVFRTRKESAEYVRLAEAEGLAFAGKEFLRQLL